DRRDDPGIDGHCREAVAHVHQQLPGTEGRSVVREGQSKNGDPWGWGWGRARGPALGAGGRRCRHLIGIREELEELLRGGIGIEPDADGVGADDGAAVDPGWPAGHVAALERFEETDSDLGIGRKRRQGYLSTLSLSSKTSAEGSVSHGLEFWRSWMAESRARLGPI